MVPTANQHRNHNQLLHKRNVPEIVRRAPPGPQRRRLPQIHDHNAPHRPRKRPRLPELHRSGRPGALHHVRSDRDGAERARLELALVLRQEPDPNPREDEAHGGGRAAAAAGHQGLLRRQGRGPQNVHQQAVRSLAGGHGGDHGSDDMRPVGGGHVLLSDERAGSHSVLQGERVAGFVPAVVHRECVQYRLQFLQVSTCTKAIVSRHWCILYMCV